MADFSSLITRINNEINDLTPGGITEESLRDLLKDGMLDGFNEGKADSVLVASAIPSGGILPDKFYNLGVISQNTTIDFADEPDDGFLHQYMIMFAVSGTPTITLSDSIEKWMFGNAPSFANGKTYLISVERGLAIYQEYDLATPPTPPSTIEVEPLSLLFQPTQGEEKTFDVLTAMGWEIETYPSWLHIETLSALGTTPVRVYCDDNRTGARRSAIIKIQSVDDESIYANLTIEQLGI